MTEPERSLLVQSGEQAGRNARAAPSPGARLLGRFEEIG
jgi:hypothetical protein